MFEFFKKYRRALTFLIVFTASAARFLYFGFEYFPQHDDYIQFHNSATSSDYFSYIIQQGLLSSRPLAGISDLYIWSFFWDHMIIAVLLISAMWTVSALLFKDVFDRYFGCTHIFTVIYLLLPLGFEGTYWVSASTRIVCGMFFTSLALWIFDRFLSCGKLYLLFLWMPLQLISFCYYEQVLVLSFAVTVLIMVIKLTEKNKRAYAALLSFVNVIIYFAFTSNFSSGTIAQRKNIILPDTPYYFEVFLPDIVNQIGAAFIKGGTLTLIKGFWRGFVMMISDKAVLYFAVTAATAVLLFFICRCDAVKENNSTKNKIKGLVFALVLAFIPITPYFIIGSTWFTLRATVASFAGIALFADILVSFIPDKKRIVSASAVSVFTAVFLIASVSELSDYKQTYDTDMLVIDEILSEEELRSASRVGILNLNSSYLSDQNYFYNGHIYGVIESSWALQGAITERIYGTGVHIPEIVPLASDGFSYYVTWNREIKRLSGFDMLYLWDEDSMSMIKVNAVGSDEEGWIVTDDAGNIRARVWEEDIYGYIEIYEIDTVE